MLAGVRFFLAVLFLLWTTGAAAQTGQDQTRKDEPQQGQQQPKSDQPGENTIPGVNVPGVAAPVDPNSYSIGANDVLVIRIWREPELSGPVQVRPDGKISLPLIGELQAGGLTPEQLRQNVHKALLEHMNRPEVMVVVQQVLSKKYYISGGVQRTGTFPLVIPTTVLEALANAGGFREFANKKKITILRGSERLKFNYNDAMKGKNLDQNIFLKDGDHIFVPE